MAPASLCPVCDGAMEVLRHDWLLQCAACGYLASRLAPSINAADILDEDRRAQALQDVRQRNFDTILDLLQPVTPRDARLLDVGCGHGWFLAAAAARGYRAVGIEPDRGIAELARSRAGDVRAGYFPEALRADDVFDVVTFNDVFEHLSDAGKVLSTVRAHLHAKGLLVINLPLSSGVFYRAADWLDRRGMGGPFGRMWQKGFPSPHVHYFNAPQLLRLARRHGFVPVSSARLQTLSWTGLRQRLRYDRSQSALATAVLLPAAGALVPVLRLLPPDIGVFVFSAGEAQVSP
jgi:SAM-dependent methyltransferase